MLRELSFILNNSRDKPVLSNVFNSKKMLCLFDTGATMPVWCRGKKVFDSVFKQSELISSNFILSGFGSKFEIVSVYKVPIFHISDGENTISFKNFMMAVCNRDFGCDLILSYTMFTKMNYSVANISDNSIFPILRIEYVKDLYNVSSLYSPVGNNALKGIAVFADSDSDESVKDTVAAFREYFKEQSGKFPKL